jgi:hypothetical protein
MPQPWRTIVDWFIAIALAIAFVLAFQAQVAKPYRIPTSSMEPTLTVRSPATLAEVSSTTASARTGSPTPSVPRAQTDRRLHSPQWGSARKCVDFAPIELTYGVSHDAGCAGSRDPADGRGGR